MDIKLSQIIFQMINFGVVFGAITFLLYKPIVKVLDERAKKAEETQKAAEDAAKAKEEIESLKKESIKDADKQAAKVMEKAKSEAADAKDVLMKQARDEAKKEREKNIKTWEQEKKGLVEEMQKDFSKAVFAVAEKVLGQAVDAKAHAKLIDQGIKELAQSMS